MKIVLFSNVIKESIEKVLGYDDEKEFVGMHGGWSKPGSVPSMGWVKGSLRIAVQEISADKEIMGIPSCGYDWDVTNPDQNAMKQWDEIQ